MQIQSSLPPTGFASPSSDHSPSWSHLMNHVTGQKKLKPWINFWYLSAATNMCSSGNLRLWMPGPWILQSLGMRYIKAHRPAKMVAAVGMWNCPVFHQQQLNIPSNTTNFSIVLATKNHRFFNWGGNGASSCRRRHVSNENSLITSNYFTNFCADRSEFSGLRRLTDIISREGVFQVQLAKNNQRFNYSSFRRQECFHQMHVGMGCI